MGKMQYLEHINITSGQEEKEKEKKERKRKQNVDTPSKRGCNKSNNNPNRPCKLVAVTN